jgi:hydroxymethylpyrimidine pyrophosphatase-like HAD family hydrolase
VYAVPANDEHHTLLKRYEQLVGCPQVLVSSYEEAIQRTVAAKLVIMTNRADELISDSHTHLPVSELTIIKGSPYPFFVEYLPAHVNKGAGLVKLCSHLGVAMEAVVAFGDGDNDREMLQFAGKGCAVQNAKPLARDAATVVLEVGCLALCPLSLSTSLLMSPYMACVICVVAVDKRRRCSP